MKVVTTRRSIGVLGLSMLCALASTQPITAGGPNDIEWKKPINVRTASGVHLADAAFDGRPVAIVLEEPDAGTSSVGIHTSDVAGKSFQRVVSITDARQPAVDVCGGLAQAVYAKRNLSDDWVIKIADGPIGGLGGFSFRTVTAGPGVSRFPDVACTEGRVFAGWYHREDDGDRMMVAHADAEFGDFSAPIDLGLDEGSRFDQSLALAGVDDNAYAVFQRSDGKLRFTSWSIGGPPGYPVTANSTQIIGPGNPNNSADGAVIAADGDKVAVAWFKCNGLDVRVSNDRGETWGPIHRVVDHVACGGDFAAYPSSIAIDGDRIVVSYLAFSFFGPGFVGLVSTTNDFATSSRDRISQKPHDEHLVGFVRASDETRLAAAFDIGDRIRFRRAQ